ncbi:MAG TPA: AAA family ATPase [Kofleriaceae bacterium]|nr:AAA family ATPase [Kofleriaceae bacterium]
MQSERPPRAALASSGRHVALRSGDDIALTDAFGIAPRQLLPGADVVDFAFVGDELWLLHRHRLHRVPLDPRAAREAPEPVELVEPATGISPFASSRVPAAVLHGEPSRFAIVAGGRCTIEPIAVGRDERVFPTIGRRVVLVGERGLRVLEVGRTAPPRPLAIAGPGRVLDVVSLFSDRAISVLMRGDEHDSFLVIKPDGMIIHRVKVPRLERWSVGTTRGIALAAVAPDSLIAIDLRYGRVVARTTVPWPLVHVAIDEEGRYAVLAGEPARDGPVVHAPTTELFADALRGRSITQHVAPDETAEAPGAPGAPDAPPGEPPGDAALPDGDPRDPPTWQAATADPPSRRIDAAAELASGSTRSAAQPAAVAAPAPAGDEIAEPPIELPDLVPIALGIQPAAIEVAPDPQWPPYASAHEHLDEILDLTAARAARAIAAAWHSGLLSVPAEDSRPFEREVRALLGHIGGYAPHQLQEADDRLGHASARTAGRARSTIAAGHRLPLIDLVREFKLSNAAAQILVMVAAPRIRGQIARLFGILGNDPNRPIVDRYLIETIVAGSGPHGIAEVARELADDAPLVAYGLVRIGAGEPGASLFGAMSVDPVLIERIRGRAPTGAIGPVTSVRHADRSLDELVLPAEVKRDLLFALAAPRPGAPLRMVIRGRRGAGRHSLVAALAARVGRGIACIDCHRLPRAGRMMAVALRHELFRALVRGCVPVVSGIEVADPSDAEGLDQLKQVLRAHPGPVVVRAAPEASLPIDPGYVSAALPPLSESERAAFWRRAVDRAQLPVTSVDGLAGRYRVGPGIIELVIAQSVERRTSRGDAGGDAAGELEVVAAQHIATRLSHVAVRVARRARFEQVALPDDVLDSIREFIARSTHRKTVYEQWGFDAKMSSSRGLTALFYGPPGTGKSMVAGLIARELGLELYRVDLARVVSKWIGETEKNLAEVFDAAEDGQVVVLFDEADSLFAKRTDVKSSVDRYANLEVNYLLQRLDTFEGICILTTNLEGSIDPAFKRRMSLRLQFPFPDEETRIRLWSAHIPPEVPVQGDFNFTELARRFPISGGYIRNSALRAAFLAAQEGLPLGQSHLLRAITLEYRELGKLSTSGRME